MKNRPKIYIVILLLIVPLVGLYGQGNYNKQQITLLKDYPDSLSYNKVTNDYTLWKKVGNEYVPVSSNLSIADVIDIQNRQFRTNDIYNQTEALFGLNDEMVPTLQATPALYNRIFNNAYLKPPNIKYDVSAVKQILSTAQGLAGNYQQLKYKFKSEKAKIDSFRKLLSNDSLSKAISDSLKQVLIDTLFALVKPLIKFNIKGSIGVNLGVMRQSTSNPAIPISSRVSWVPIFGVDANFSTSAALGSKISLPSLGFSTRGIGSSLGSLGSGFGLVAPQFGVDNAWRISYKNDGDEILRSLDFFNTGFITPSLLIPSVNSIFGVSAKLQFGRLAFATTLGKQNSQMQSLQILPGKGTYYNLDVSNYDENKNFLLAQYFYKTFNKSLSKLPAVLSNIRILRVEVWLTNRYNQTNNIRQIIAFSDMAESQPYNIRWRNGTIDSLPHNAANDLYNWLLAQGGLRDAKDVNLILTNIGMKQSVGYEQIYARKLNENEYYVQPQLGYIALKIQLQPDDILGVAFQYSYNGRIYQVGEFSESVPPDTLGNNPGISKNLYVKLLKGTAANTQLPLWNLMMKNIYTISPGPIQSSDFTMDIVYNNPGKGSQVNLPSSVLKSAYTNKTLLQLLRLDTLNAQGNPLPDGVFDYIDNVTVLPELGKIVFPVLEPFGKDLSYVLTPDTTISNQYLFQILYDTLQAIARTYSYLNRYVLRGSYKGIVNVDGLVQLGYNITPGSVKVMAGSMALVEGVDYIVNYGLGNLQILNPIYLNSQIPLNVLFENNSLFGLQTNFFWGVRWDYLLKNRKFKIGGTFEGVKQLPFTQKVRYGQDPTNNQMYGIDFSYMDTYPWLTSIINFYPTIKTQAPSTLSVYGEGALLNPGHPNQIGKGEKG
ncbi:MAG: cell surface protein SprA, partial [Chitinophagaceae bacterium]